MYTFKEIRDVEALVLLRDARLLWCGWRGSGSGRSWHPVAPDGRESHWEYLTTTTINGGVVFAVRVEGDDER